MAKIILNDGTEKFVSTREARRVCQTGEGKMAEVFPHYMTRQILAEPVKVKRKRRTKAEIEADEAAAGEACED